MGTDALTGESHGSNHFFRSFIRVGDLESERGALRSAGEKITAGVAASRLTVLDFHEQRTLEENPGGRMMPG